MRPEEAPYRCSSWTPDSGTVPCSYWSSWWRKDIRPTVIADHASLDCLRSDLISLLFLHCWTTTSPPVFRKNGVRMGTSKSFLGDADCVESSVWSVGKSYSVVFPCYCSVKKILIYTLGVFFQRIISITDLIWVWEKAKYLYKLIISAKFFKHSQLTRLVIVDRDNFNRSQ